MKTKPIFLEKERKSILKCRLLNFLPKLQSGKVLNKFDADDILKLILSFFAQKKTT